MAQYRIGTATFTNGSATVTGSGTAWLSNLSAGDYIVRQGTTTDTYETYQIGGITNNTTLTLTAPYGGATASNVAYAAHIDFHPNGAPKFDNGDIETPSILNRWLLDIVKNSEIGTAAALDAQTSLNDTTADRLMKVGAFGVGAENAQLGALNLNDFKIGQLVYGNSGSTNKPTNATGGCVLVKPSDGNTFVQEWDDVINNERHIRTSFNGVLGQWIRQYGANNILGTVSQSGGVPTGAIFERDSNANGEYVKLVDGTMICTLTSTNTITVTSNGVFGIVWTFPAVFANTNYSLSGITQPESSPDYYGVIYTESNSVSSSAIVIRNGAFAQNIIARKFTAIGRWY